MTAQSGGSPRGYPPEILGDGLNAKFICWNCELILRNPVQSYCGHRVCRECLGFVLRNSKDTPVICKSCIDENSVGDESTLKEDETFPDNAIKREMSALAVTCSFTSCTWTGLFKDYEAHLADCNYVPVACDVCGVVVPKQELSQHKDSDHPTSGIRLCPYGCHQQIDLADINKHIADNIHVHFESLHNRLTSSERQQQVLQEQANRTQASSHGGEIGAVGGVGAAAGDSDDLALMAEKMNIYEGVITVLNREVEKLTLQMDASERQRIQTEQLLNSQDLKIKTIERSLTLKDATIAELELKVTGLENTSYDGTLLWKITDISRRRQEAVSGRITSIYSTPFYTSRTGYKMCARLYMNGDGMGKGTHVSLFFVVMRGAYDALLKWPFRQKVTLMFLDQNGREHVVDAFRPDLSSSSFKRPTTEMNIASGCPLLMPLTTLDSGNNAYVKDNTAFIKIIVSCDDLNT